jgi:ribosomal protein S27AE
MRERNGYVDNGSPIRGGRKTCPNCGSSKYIETVSKEQCNACGLLCDYWGGGSNKVYDRYTENLWAERERIKERREREEIEEEERWQNEYSGGDDD